ncbi:MAG TPA: hypothetical protein VN306_02995, partial [Mycobacterium sp.]|nr:hypothetical protein [Mycobacterium sp.]
SWPEASEWTSAVGAHIAGSRLDRRLQQLINDQPAMSARPTGAIGAPSPSPPDRNAAASCGPRRARIY